jgi:hypothetical protein
MSDEFTIKEGRDIRELSGSGRGAWAGDGATHLGLTGDVDPKDFEALSELVTDVDEDQDDEDPPQVRAGERVSLLEQLRRDGVL